MTDKNICKAVNCNTSNINSLSRRLNEVQCVDIPTIVEALDEFTNYSWILETATGPTGSLVSGPFEVTDKTVVRFWSDNGITG